MLLWALRRLSVFGCCAAGHWPGPFASAELRCWGRPSAGPQERLRQALYWSGKDFGHVIGCVITHEEGERSSHLDVNRMKVPHGTLP